MVLGLWFESVRAMLFLFHYSKRASRSHAKTGLNFRSKNDVLPAWELNFDKSRGFSNFQKRSFTCMGAQFS